MEQGCPTVANSCVCPEGKKNWMVFGITGSRVAAKGAGELDEHDGPINGSQTGQEKRKHRGAIRDMFKGIRMGV
jgi:hypothetical protein